MLWVLGALLGFGAGGVHAALDAGAVLGASGDGFQRALAPRAFQFPEDHGVKSAFRTQWWYLTAHLKDDAGQPFGVQFTLFRQGLLAPVRAPDRASPWQATPCGWLTWRSPRPKAMTLRSASHATP